MQKKVSKKINLVKKEVGKTNLSDARLIVSEKTSCEKNMELKTKSTNQEILVGLGTNLYNSPAYQASDSPLTKYRVSAYLKFPVTNVQLLSKIYEYFDYDEAAEVNRNPEIGWLITDESRGYYLPEMFFFTATQLITFLRQIQENICLRDVLDGTLISTGNLESMVWESI